jgi:hypothetical protein
MFNVFHDNMNCGDLGITIECTINRQLLLCALYGQVAVVMKTSTHDLDFTRSGWYLNISEIHRQIILMTATEYSCP